MPPFFSTAAVEMPTLSVWERNSDIALNPLSLFQTLISLLQCMCGRGLGHT